MVAGNVINVAESMQSISVHAFVGTPDRTDKECYVIRISVVKKIGRV